jgi:phosphoribosylglycinamide formyltransferase
VAISENPNPHVGQGFLLCPGSGLCGPPVVDYTWSAVTLSRQQRMEHVGQEKSSGAALQDIPRVLVLISGTGTNLQALIDATNSSPPRLHARISHVIANLGQRAKPGLARARRAGIPATVRTLKSYKDQVPSRYPNQVVARQSYDADLAEYILNDIQRVQLIVCAGWMHILGPAFLGPIKSAGIAIINLHPALPGAFSGADALERAWNAFQEGKIKRTGIMIHHVIEEVDEGEPIVVKEIEIFEGESLKVLEERVHVVEHQAIVEGANIALATLKRGS